MVEMLNKGVTPVVCQKGSVGACGDLSPMAQAALLLMGEGEAFYQGERLPGRVAMERAGIPVPGLHARDGLAAINGSNVLTAISALHIYDMNRWLKQADIAAAMSIEALLGNLKPYHAKLHELRGFRGAITSAQNIMKVIAGSDLTTGKMKTKVQDAYSMRSTPQVIGAARDALAYARSQVEIELNGVGDNPIFVPELQAHADGRELPGVAGVACRWTWPARRSRWCRVLSERRMNRLTNPALSQGLPDFLAHEPGFYSGLMLSQYTADMLIVEQRILSAPASIQSIPAAADQEDFVSMGMNTALKNGQILDNAYGVLGIEFMAAAQALDFRDVHARQRHAESPRGDPPPRRAPRGGPPALRRPQRDEGAGEVGGDPRRGRTDGRGARVARLQACDSRRRRRHAVRREPPRPLSREPRAGERALRS